ncbi:MAG: hypothetical protein ABRQ25_19140 [Clostridiaceae bacterium]
MANDNKAGEFIKLITDLANLSELNENTLNEYVEKFTSIYSSGYRHEYSSVTRVLFLLNSVEDRDFFSAKIKDIKKVIEDKETNEEANEEAKKGIQKLWDHINLENIRLAELSELSNKVKTASDKAQESFDKVEGSLNDFEGRVTKATEDTNKAQKKLNKM